MLGPMPAAASELLVAVAANFASLAREMGEEFRRSEGVQVRIASGSSGALYAQIRNGAPYDVFLSADTTRPEALLQQRRVHGDVFQYARGKLALYAPKWPLSEDLASNLQDPRVQVLAMANSRTAPYGLAAQQVLEGIETELGKLPGRRAIGSSIGQAFQYVQTGNADMGFVAFAQLLALPDPVDMQRVQLIPTSRYVPIEQSGAILNTSSQPKLAQRWVSYLLSDEVQDRISQAGYFRGQP